MRRKFHIIKNVPKDEKSPLLRVLRRYFAEAQEKGYQLFESRKKIELLSKELEKQ